MLRDYLFLDEKKINSFFEQISDPNKHERTGSIKASLSFPKVGIEAELKSESRPFTLNEKISILEDHLKENEAHAFHEFDLLKQDYFEEAMFSYSLDFVKILHFKASRILIGDGKNAEIMMWISTDPQFKIYLLEQVRTTDERAAWWSSFSTLMAILEELNDNDIDSFQQIIGEDAMEKFDLDPLFYLKKIGKMAGPPRTINCLLKVRCTFMAQTKNNEYEKALVGYPIYIY